MEVSAKHEGQTLTFFLVGELDHHGAKGLLEIWSARSSGRCHCRWCWIFPASHLWTAPASPWRCGVGSGCGSWAAP